MFRKAALSIAVALVSLSLFVVSVLAQTGETTGEEAETPTTLPITLPISVQPNVAAANVVQTIPVTLTLSIPGPTGLITVEVPVFLSLDIRIGISPQLTTTFSVTPSVVSDGDDVVEVETDATPTAIATPTEEVTAVATEVPATPLALAPTATTVPATAEPTDVLLPTATPTTTVALETVGLAPACQDSRASITLPGVNQVLSGKVNIIGTASHENFLYYKVEYAEGADVDPNDTFSYLADARVQVVGALLAAFDTTNFVNGPYTIKLTVVDNSGNFPPPCTVSVVIAN